MSRSDIAVDTADFDDKERENLSVSNSESTKDFADITELPLEDNGWISPPDSVCSSSSESGITSQNASFPGSFNDPSEESGQVSKEPSSIEAPVDQNSASISETGFQEISPSGKSESKITEVNNNCGVSFEPATNEPNEYLGAVASQSDESVTVAPETLHLVNKNSEEESESRGEISSLNKVKILHGDDHEAHDMHAGGRVGRGKMDFMLFSHYYIVYILCPFCSCFPGQNFFI